MRLVTFVVFVLAVAVGVLHLSLDALLFHWHLSPFLTFRGRSVFNPLPILFLLNFAGYVVLAGLFLLATGATTAFQRAVDVLLLAMTVGTLVGWNVFHRPNPRGLGHIAVAMEVVLVVLLLVRLGVTSRSRVLSPAVR